MTPETSRLPPESRFRGARGPHERQTHEPESLLALDSIVSHQLVRLIYMRFAFLAVAVLLASCASRHSNDPEIPQPPVLLATKEIQLSDYSKPFGSAPDSPDLEAVFLALPDQLAGDMTASIRKGFIEQCEPDTTNHMFDRKKKYITYFNDSPYNPYQASSIFIIKILPSSKFNYVVAIHLEKPCALDVPPSPSNTFFLASKDSRWIDVTNELLPKQVSRDWCFQPLWSSNVIEVGPYQKNPGGHWTLGLKKFDLVWIDDHLRVTKPSSSKFTF